MAYTYTAWSVVFGEQPTASKWNIIGSNMAAVDERIGANFSAGTDSPIWWEEIGRVTGTSLSITNLPNRKYLRLYINVLATGGTIAPGLRFNNDSTANYAIRFAVNDNADTAAGSTSLLALDAGGAVAETHKLVLDVFNVASEMKYLFGHMIRPNGAISVAPVRNTIFGKWGNTSDAISRVDIVLSSGTGSFSSSSQLVVLGHD